jgi:phospholipid-binding lipoprotein MlaA
MKICNKNIMNKKLIKPIATTLLISSFLTLNGCSGLYKKNPQDPFINYNKSMFHFNVVMDKAIVGPVSMVYTKVLPPFARTGVGNFFNNVNTIPAMANDLLQARPKLMGRDFIRLIINTTLGIGGLFDVAKHMGLPNNPQSFGRTLYVWGWKDSSYFVLPFLGPSTVRGTVSLVPTYFMDPVKYVHPDWLKWSLTGLDFVQTASVQLPRMREIAKMSVNPYIGIRNAYMQNLNHSLTKNAKIPKLESSEGQDEEQT